MPVKGFKSITVPEDFYIQIQEYYKEYKEELREERGVRSFSAFACYCMKQHLDQLRGEQPIRVLVVEDEQPMLYLTRGFLEQEEDFRVDTALSAEEALKKLSEQKYDVVVSDYKMPEIDGLEFLSILRRQGNLIPFIFLTGRGGEEVAAAAFKEKASGYIIRGKNLESTYTELTDAIRQGVTSTRRRMGEKKS